MAGCLDDEVTKAVVCCDVDLLPQAEGEQQGNRHCNKILICHQTSDADDHAVEQKEKQGGGGHHVVFW